MDSIGIAQECLHSIRSRKSKALVLKLDLAKDYDKVNWGLLRLILLQIGLPMEVCNWVMAYVSSAYFVVLLNGTPTSFFKSSRGLKQGSRVTPLPPSFPFSYGKYQ